MTGVLYGIARFCVRRRFVVLGVWLVVAIALVAVSHQLGDNTNDNLSLPGTDSQKATETLAKSFPDQANGSSPIVLHAKSGKLTDSKYASAVNSAASQVAEEPFVASVGRQSPHLAGRVRPQQGPGHGLSVGDDIGQPGVAFRRAGPEDHRRRQPGETGWSGRAGRAASSARRSPPRRPSPAS